MKLNLRHRYYPIFVILCLSCWLAFTWDFSLIKLFSENITIMATMAFGSFVAGASSEGGGAIAFPVMTLVLGIEPSVARNFSLAIQSVGMLAASLFILDKKIPFDRDAIIWGSIGGLFGITLSSLMLTDLFPPLYIKAFFVSLWLAFGIALFWINQQSDQVKNDRISIVTNLTIIKLLLFGFLGGIVSGLIGNGIDILMFCLLTLHFNVNEKTATATSIILMTINTIIGLTIHSAIIQDFHTLSPAFNYWLSAIPIVIFGAPLGAWFVSKLDRSHIAAFLYFIIVVQFLTALYVFKTSDQLSFSLIVFCSCVFLIGLLIFFLLSQKGNATIDYK